MVTDELLTFLFDGRPHALRASFAVWLTTSRRFRDFVAANHTKIRKKLRTAQELEALRDLQLELETAWLLLGQRSLTLLYEPQRRDHARGPDFAASFTTSSVFMVEVTRMRAQARALPDMPDRAPATPCPASTLTSPRLGDRLSDTLCSKLGQLLPQRSNLLIVGLEGPPPAHPEVHAALLGIQLRAESNDPTLLRRHSFRDRAQFFRCYQRLSALLLRGSPLQPGEPAVVWVNPQAKHPLPPRVRTALADSHTP